MVFLLAIFGWILSKRFGGVVAARGKDVDFWHRQLISAENDLPPDERYFTLFKYSQKLERDGSDHAITQLKLQPHSDFDIQELLGKHIGHTRRFIDLQLNWGVRFLWLLLTVGSLVAIAVQLSN
jgi:hypothetical protein